MPHITVEYSSNLEDHVNLRGLVDDIHETVVQSGLFEPADLRTRAARRTIYRIADGRAENIFLHVVARMREGRTVAERRSLGGDLLRAAREALAGLPASTPVAVSVEIQEIDREMLFRHITIKQH